MSVNHLKFLLTGSHICAYISFLNSGAVLNKAFYEGKNKNGLSG